MSLDLKNRTVLVTGACGTIGRELVRQLVDEHEVGELIGLDNNESELFFLEERLREAKNARFFLADVRDAARLGKLCEGVEVVFHTAAFKHVILCERSPLEAVQTNILGVANLIAAALQNNVAKVIFTSSDKAVNPTSVMGTSKLMGERLISAANENARGQRTVFAATRFGNVLGSRGSVIPIFREQIRRGGPVTLTDPAMTRFIMSIKEAVRLVIASAELALGGEVFITKMPCIRISDLAAVMIQELAPAYGHDPAKIPIARIGVKAGEKMYEELMNSEETRRALELARYFVVKPAWTSNFRNVRHEYPGLVSQEVATPYNSANVAPLSREAWAVFSRKAACGRRTTCYQPSQPFWPKLG